MSNTNTTTKSTSAKTAKASKTAKAAKTVATVEDRRVRVFGRQDGIVPTATTMTVDYEVRDTLDAYREEMGFKRLSDAVAYLLTQVGYELAEPQRKAS